MDIQKAIFLVNDAMLEIYHRPSEIHCSDKAAFRDQIVDNLKDPAFRNIVIDSDREIADQDWLTFLWFVKTGNAVRINDALHGFLWPAGGNEETFGKALDEQSRFRQMVIKDPIVQAEYAKCEDYIKHIRWVYHKTQNLPRIVIIGRGNVPERLHGLRQAHITVLGSANKLPPDKAMFPDFGQRRRFKVIDPYDFTDVMNSKDYKMFCTQNVVIIDDYHIALNEGLLKEKILEASYYLTEHGRILFDLPMYDHAEYRLQSPIWRAVKHFTPSPAPEDNQLLSMDDANDIDDYVHDVVKWINESEYMERNGWMFKIEELKFTDTGLRNSIAARVYLKKCFTT